MRRPASLAAVLAVACLSALGLSACGNERQRPPRAASAAPVEGLRTVRLPREGIVFRGPANWRMGEARPPQVAAIASGEVAINVWRYRRQERLPRSDRDLQRARRALVAAARARDRSLRVISSRALRLDGVPGVELVATERIGLTRRRVRSTHLYAHGAEVVVDAYAPPRQFLVVDRFVFVPLLRSLRLEQPARRP